ncbi:centriolin-like [Pomacea canaliculata]|uniref:centriolin-like n=1 Tax=Pomacea canaliculata TaxID=400727 RepID=UPI000D72FCB1|nr:centriolin-like [Pomacea canaliculata]XP_025077259.1 centriolin-like [Pomacea canaliculata]
MSSSSKKKRSKTKIDKLQRQLLKYQAVAVKLGLHVTQLQQTEDELRGHLRFLEDQKTALENNVTALQQEKETLQIQVMQAVTEYEKVRKQADTQGTYINQLTDAYQVMQREAMMHQEDADRGRHDVQTLEAQLQETWELVQSRDTSIVQLQESLEAASTRHQDLESVLRARSVDVWRYQTEVEEGRKIIRILEGKLRQQS